MTELEDLLADVGWVTLAEAGEITGASRSTLRSWYRKGEIPSRLEAGPHGPERLVPLDAVMERAQHSPRLWKRTALALHDEAEVSLLRQRVTELEARVAELERRLQSGS
jgi:predicted site-specific integrase-resolvase